MDWTSFKWAFGLAETPPELRYGEHERFATRLFAYLIAGAAVFITANVILALTVIGSKI